MRIILIILSHFILVATLISCSPKPPNKVENSFTKQFSRAQDINWVERENEQWEASFYLKKFHFLYAKYSSTGQWLETDFKIVESDLPENVLQTLKAKFPKAIIFQSYLIKTPKGNGYEFEIESNGSIYCLGLYTANKLQVLNKATDRLRKEFVFQND